MNSPGTQAPSWREKPALPPALRGFENINRYWDRTRQGFAAKILPGQYYVTTHDEYIVTVLGSCVSACIRDPLFGVGGMNHFMLPSGTGAGEGWPGVATRYGNYAMEHLINAILKHGGRREHLEIKVFGGGRILAQMTDIGRRNIEFIREYIHVEGLRIAAENLGDIHPRKVVYSPLTGKAQQKKLRSLHNGTVVEREKAYLHALDREPVAGEVELF